LRIALLTMLETADPPASGLRAALRVGGTSLARHQLAVALSLSCERIVCIARALDPEIAAVQRAAEQAGAHFHLITETRPLVGLVTAVDEVFVLADGLLAATDAVVPLLEAAPSVLVQPIEVGLPAGFERIDLNLAAAGAMRLPGRLVERLADLPHDCDAVSALQRIALQGGVKQVELPARLLEAGSWRLVHGEGEAHQAESDWIRLRTAPSLEGMPSDIGIRAAVRQFGPALMQAGNGGRSLQIAALVSLFLALVVGWFGVSVAGLVLAGLAWAIWRGSALLNAIERQSQRRTLPAIPGDEIFVWVIDAAMVIVIAWNITGIPDELGFLGRAFPAVLMMLMLRLVPRVMPGRWPRLLDDRGLVALGLAIIALGGLRAEVVGSLAAGLALLAAAWPVPADRLTRA